MRSLTCFSSGCCFLPSVKESQSSVCWSAESCQLLPCDQESVLVQCFWKSEWLILFMLFNVISNKKAVRFRFFLLVFFPSLWNKVIDLFSLLALFCLPPHLWSELWCWLPDPQSWVLCPRWAGRAGSCEPRGPNQPRDPAGSAAAPCCWEMAAGATVRWQGRKKRGNTGLTSYSCSCIPWHTQEGQLVLMGIFRGLSWKPLDLDSSVARGLLSAPKWTICLLCLEGNCQNKNLLTTVSTETLALYGAF